MKKLFVLFVLVFATATVSASDNTCANGGQRCCSGSWC